MEKMKSENCGPGCDCGKPSGNTKVKTVICLIVLLAIGGIFVYKAKSAKQTAPVNTATAFAAPVANEVNEQKPAVPTIDKQEPAVQTVEDEKKSRRVSGFTCFTEQSSCQIRMPYLSLSPPRELT